MQFGKERARRVIFGPQRTPPLARLAEILSADTSARALRDAKNACLMTDWTTT